MRGPNPAAWTTLLFSCFRSAHPWMSNIPSKYSYTRSAFQRSIFPSLLNSLLPSQSHHTLLSHTSRQKFSINRHATPTIRYLSMSSAPDNGNGGASTSFQVGDKIQVEVISFGPLGASVSVVGMGHGDDVNLLPVDAEPYGTGLIVQQEISYFRQARGNVDVVRGEVLPGFVQKVREEDGKIDIGLRAFGGKAKAEEVSTLILERLQSASGSTLPVGDKSSPSEINAEFPGVSKAVFKKAVGALYKKGLVSPSPNSITLTKK